MSSSLIKIQARLWWEAEVTRKPTLWSRLLSLGSNWPILLWRCFFAKISLSWPFVEGRDLWANSTDHKCGISWGSCQYHQQVRWQQEIQFYCHSTDKFNCWLKFLNLSFLCSGEKPLALYVFSENKEVQRKNTLSSFHKIRCVHKDIGCEDDNNDFSDPAHVQDRHQQWGTPYQRHTHAPHVRGCSQHHITSAKIRGW